MGAFLYRLLVLAYPPRLRRDFGDEIRDTFHRRLAAARPLGPVAVVRLLSVEIIESLRDGLRARLAGETVLAHARSEHESPPRVVRMLSALIRDLRSGLRVFRAAPGFALAAVIVLALAIGANSAMFAVINTVLLRPLPFAEPEELMAIFETNPERGWTRAQVASANYLDWRERVTAFAGIAAHNDWLVERTWLREGEPVVVGVNEVTWNFFEVLGAKVVGRTFDPGDDWLGGERRIVLSHRFWTRQFAADSAILGRTLTLDGAPYTVVGVADANFQFPFPEIDGWVPVAWDPAARTAVSFRRAHGMRAIGRVAPGVRAETAAAELAATAAALEAQHPETNTQMGIGIVPLQEWIVGDTRSPLLLLWLAVGMVLAIACANVANMQLARATDRRAEMALRGALGAGRGQLVRQNLVESLVLAAVGGAVGLALAWAGVRALVQLLPPDFPRLIEVGLDGQVLTFTLITVATTGLAFGLAPSHHALRTDPARELQSKHSSGDQGKGRAAAMLVALEVALVLPVAIGAMLMMRTLGNIYEVDPGFDVADTTALGVSLPRNRYDAEQRQAFFDAVLGRLRDTLGIDAAAISTRLPFLNQRWSSDFRAESWDPDRYGVGVRHDEVSEDLFRTMGVPFLDGSDFERADLETEPVVIVNRALADTFFGDRSPVGERLCFDRAAEDCRYWYRVVGVVDNVRRASLTADEEPSIYASILQQGSPGGFLLVRSALPTADVVDLATTAVRELDAELPFHTVTTMDIVVRQSISRERLLLVLFGTFAAVAALLAGFGVYSVVAYATASRTREIGIRVSLGARPADVMRSVLGRGLLPVAAGVALGLTLAFVAAGAFAGLVFGVSVRDPISFAAVALGLLGVALVASVVPGMRALRIDPAVALRTD